MFPKEMIFIHHPVWPLNHFWNCGWYLSSWISFRTSVRLWSPQKSWIPTSVMKTGWVNHAVGCQEIHLYKKRFLFFMNAAAPKAPVKYFFQITIPLSMSLWNIFKRKKIKTCSCFVCLDFPGCICLILIFPCRDFHLQLKFRSDFVGLSTKQLECKENKTDSTRAFYF